MRQRVSRIAHLPDHLILGKFGDLAVSILLAYIEQLSNLKVSRPIYLIIVGTADREEALQLCFVFPYDFSTEVLQFRKYQLDLSLPDSHTHHFLQICNLNSVLRRHSHPTVRHTLVGKRRKNS